MIAIPSFEGGLLLGDHVERHEDGLVLNNTLALEERRLVIILRMPRKEVVIIPEHGLLELIRFLEIE